MPKKAGGPRRSERLIIPVVVFEKKQVDRQAKEANLNTADYVREKLGLAKARTRRNQKDEELENPLGDPENAVDVEELALELFRYGAMTKAEARKEAKRRLMAAAER